MRLWKRRRKPTVPGSFVEENLGENDAQAIRDAVTNFVDQGCTIIVGCSFGYGEVLNELANSGDYGRIVHESCTSQALIRTRPTWRTSSVPWRRPGYSRAGMAAASVSRDGSSGIRGSVPVHRSTDRHQRLYIGGSGHKP